MVPHPLDPLSGPEIEIAVSLVKKEHGDVHFHVVSLLEPRKAEMTAWLKDPQRAARPVRIAETVVVSQNGKVFDGFIDLRTQTITKWEQVDAEQPIVSKDA